MNEISRENKIVYAWIYKDITKLSINTIKKINNQLHHKLIQIFSLTFNVSLYFLYFNYNLPYVHFNFLIKYLKFFFKQ